VERYHIGQKLGCRCPTRIN